MTLLFQKPLRFILIPAVTLFALLMGCTPEMSNPGVSQRQEKSDAAEAGLAGRVKTIRIETAKFFNQDGRWKEGPRRFASTTRYDEKGNLQEEAFYKPNGQLQVRVVYTYDGRGRHAEEAVFKGDASHPSKLVYHHDRSGRVAEKIVYNADGRFDWKVHFTYDAKGNKQEVAVYQGDGILSAKRVYLHDGDGNEIEEAVYAGEGLVSKGIFGYDESGNKITEVFARPRGTITARYRYDYAFDAAGNWVRRVRSGINLVSGEAEPEQSDVTYRTLHYH